MSWAVATAAGKDATLALHRAREGGLDVRWALNVFEGNTGTVRFHGTPRARVEDHARALGLEPLFGETHPLDFEEALAGLLGELRRRGGEGVIFGNLHLTDIRSWYEERVAAAGLSHREPIWGLAPSRAVEEVVALGYRATVISVNLESGDPDWLGRELGPELLDRFRAAGIDPAGERGEYHTFVHDGPGFRGPVELRFKGEGEREGHRFLVWEE